jgi:hypothetical protein
MKKTKFRDLLNGKSLLYNCVGIPILENFAKCMFTYRRLFEDYISDDECDLFFDEYDYLPIPTTYKISVIDYKGYNDIETFKYEIMYDRKKIRDKFINFMLQRGHVLKNKNN